MIRHIVLFRFQTDASPIAIKGLIDAFRLLPRAITSVQAFEDGPSVSHEGLEDGYQHAFSMAFADVPARDAYLAHPAHQAFVTLAGSVVAQALVFDYELPV